MSEARPAKMTAARFARLHNEDISRAADELSFDMPEKPSVMDGERPVSEGRRAAYRYYLDLSAHQRGFLTKSLVRNRP